MATRDFQRRALCDFQQGPMFERNATQVVVGERLPAHIHMAQLHAGFCPVPAWLEGTKTGAAALSAYNTVDINAQQWITTLEETIGGIIIPDNMYQLEPRTKTRYLKATVRFTWQTDDGGQTPTDHWAQNVIELDYRTNAVVKYHLTSSGAFGADYTWELDDDGTETTTGSLGDFQDISGGDPDGLVDPILEFVTDTGGAHCKYTGSGDWYGVRLTETEELTLENPWTVDDHLEWSLAEVNSLTWGSPYTVLVDAMPATRVLGYGSNWTINYNRITLALARQISVVSPVLETPVQASYFTKVYSIAIYNNVFSDRTLGQVGKSWFYYGAGQTEVGREIVECVLHTPATAQPDNGSNTIGETASEWDGTGDLHFSRDETAFDGIGAYTLTPEDILTAFDYGWAHPYTP